MKNQIAPTFILLKAISMAIFVQLSMVTANAGGQTWYAPSEGAPWHDSGDAEYEDKFYQAWETNPGDGGTWEKYYNSCSCWDIPTFYFTDGWAIYGHYSYYFC